MQFSTIHTTFDSTEAQLIRSRLEVANFHPNVANEASVSCQGFSESTLIRIEVPEDEAADAKEFLAAKESAG